MNPSAHALSVILWLCLTFPVHGTEAYPPNGPLTSGFTECVRGRVPSSPIL